MDACTRDIVITAIVGWIYSYGIWNIASEIFFTTISISVVLITVISLVIYFSRIPMPRKAIVETVIGKDPFHESSETDEFVMRVIAHRGAGLDAPENSLVAFKMCAEKGCSGVEFDVTLTADDVPIIFHDNTLERLTGLTLVVRKMTLKELSKFDISVKHPLQNKFESTRIPKLTDTVLQCLNNKQRMFIDIKEYNKKIVKVILDLFEKFPDLQSKAVCSSFYPNVIYMIRRKNPKIVCSLAWRPLYFSHESYTLATGPGIPRTNNWFKLVFLRTIDALYAWALPRFIYYIVGISVILLHKDAISGKIINEWRDRGIRVMAWTVNHPIEKQYCSRILKITYLTDTLIGEGTAHSSSRTSNIQ